MRIRTAPCVNALSASQWKNGGGGAGLRLRVDSRDAVSGAVFQIPAAMLPKAADAKYKTGRIRVVRAGGKQVVYILHFPKTKGSTLLTGAGTPRVRLTRTGVIASGLPAHVGIVELTLYTRNKTSPKALLKKGKKA